jgi:hypothetical protein
MPQLKKGGKFVFGWSLITPEGTVTIPQQAFDEYTLKSSNKVILISGSKRTGGFCVSSRSLIEQSDIHGLFDQYPSLSDYGTNEGEFVKYKGRFYCWVNLNNNSITLSREMMKMLDVKIGNKLLSIRGSDIAFVMGAKGPLIERANQSEKYIEQY